MMVQTESQNAVASAISIHAHPVRLNLDMTPSPKALREKVEEAMEYTALKCPKGATELPDADFRIAVGKILELFAQLKAELVEGVEEVDKNKRHFACGNCGCSPLNTYRFCELGCGRDWNRMDEIGVGNNFARAKMLTILERWI